MVWEHLKERAKRADVWLDGKYESDVDPERVERWRMIKRKWHEIIGMAVGFFLGYVFGGTVGLGLVCGVTGYVAVHLWRGPKDRRKEHK